MEKFALSLTLIHIIKSNNPFYIIYLIYHFYHDRTQTDALSEDLLPIFNTIVI